MKRAVLAAFLAGGVALALGACSDDSDGGGGNWSGGGGNCQQYTSCGTCTPVAGCGWCFNNYGGACASDPNECANASEFTWTWNSTGCPDLDAQVVPLDAGAARDAVATDANEASSDAAGDGAISPTH